VRKKRIVLVALVLLVMGGVLWFVTHREEEVVVRGNLSATDVAEIKRAVRSEMRREVFPNFSWSSVKGLPAAAWKYSQNTIRVVTVQESMGEVIVFVGKKRGTLDGFEVIKEADGWHVYPSAIWHIIQHDSR
jgi:hypothetical protein